MRRLYLLLLLVLLYQASWAATSPVPPKLPVIHIDASTLSPLAIGLETGRQTKALFPDIEYRYDTHLAAILSQAAFEEILLKRLPPLLQQLDQAYQEELKGVGGAWSLASDSKPGDGQLSLAEYQILNLLPDLGLPPDGSGFGVFDQATAENAPIVGRNLDWQGTPELRSLQAITVYTHADQSVVNIGFAGIIAVLSGFNDKGLFLANFNAEPYSPYRQNHPLPDKPHATGFDLRKALETRTSGRAAAKFLAANAYGFSNSILIADKKSVQVLEYPSAGTATLRAWKSPLRAGKQWEAPQQIAVVDCLLLPAMPDNCKDANDITRWQRLRELARFSPSQPAKVADVANILLDTANRRYEIFNAQTLQSMVYLPTLNHLYLYAVPANGEHPSAPSHQAYLDLLPESEDGGISLVWFIWLLIVVMLGGVIWVRKQALLPQQHKL